MKKFILSMAILSFAFITISATAAPEIKNKEFADEEGNIVKISIINKADIHEKVSDEEAPKLILYTIFNNLEKKFTKVETLEKKKVDDQYVMLLKVSKEGQQTMSVGFLTYSKNDKIITIGYLMPSKDENDVKKIEEKLSIVRKNLE